MLGFDVRFRIRSTNSLHDATVSGVQCVGYMEGEKVYALKSPYATGHGDTLVRESDMISVELHSAHDPLREPVQRPVWPAPKARINLLARSLDEDNDW